MTIKPADHAALHRALADPTERAVLWPIVTFLAVLSPRWATGSTVQLSDGRTVFLSAKIARALFRMGAP